MLWERSLSLPVQKCPPAGMTHVSVVLSRERNIKSREGSRQSPETKEQDTDLKGVLMFW